MPAPFQIHPDITQAQTPPVSFYTDPTAHDLVLSKVFRRSWQFITDLESLKVPGKCHPHTLLEGSLNEPIVLTRDKQDRLHCLSNVCTHRGTILCEHPGVEKSLTCRYHGRRFDLDGTCKHMPEFEQVVDFPAKSDHLASVPCATWPPATNGPAPFLFAGVDPATSLETQLGPVTNRHAYLPFQEYRFDPNRSRDYLVQANWALYVENYLEGFHVPFVHPSLTKALDYANYTTELFDHCNLQLGVANPGELTFDLPESSPDHGKQIAGYYWWLFPNTMFNFYPWGLSINIVLPLAPDRTRVRFLTYMHDESKYDQGAGAGLDRVEREDEAIVEAIQRATHSSFYSRGRYSPTREQGVHHFHQLLAKALAT